MKAAAGINLLVEGWPSFTGGVPVQALWQAWTGPSHGPVSWDFEQFRIQDRRRRSRLLQSPV